MKYEDLVKECEMWRHTLAALCNIDAREISPGLAVEAIEKEKSEVGLKIRGLRNELGEERLKNRRLEADLFATEQGVGRMANDLRKEVDARIDEILKQLGFD
jgi:hypothetical protein